MIPKPIVFVSLFLLSWLISSRVSSQPITSVGQIMSNLPKFRPDADTSLNVSKLSKPEFYNLIDKLYVVDQKYRRQYMATREETAKMTLRRRIKVNDEANQHLLLKGLKAFGWPNDYRPYKTIRDSRSVKVWYIVHHTSNVAPQLEQQLRVLIEGAYKQGRFSKQLWELYLQYHPRLT